MYIKISVLWFVMQLGVLPANASATDSPTKHRPSIHNTFNVFTSNTDSVMGNAVARHFSQLLYINKIAVRSGLVIKENKISGNTNEISLETPLRVVTTYRYLMTQPRTWSLPKDVAEKFVSAAQKGGLLATRKQ